eukprot:c12669_g1_i1.p1 GENE.c12669_g1_i1~~c12669_g1_i1.p1  ORF type:complete len:537 (+),score=163.70 c12669_g1_i1:58-1611(+)
MSQFKKYDRQLRIWGGEGQQALNKAHICLLNASALGAETLKNLVLPGIGKFTVVDGQRITLADIGNNFFITSNDLGRSRAEVVTENLKELNPEDVDGSFVDEDPSVLIASRPEFFDGFTLVVASQLRDAECKTLDAICEKLNIPLLVLRCTGLFGALFLAGQNHQVVESKPDFPIDDLRLSRPFPALLQHASHVDLALEQNHNHIPFPLILLKSLQLWKDKHGGEAPATSQEKQEFKAFVQSFSFDITMEENFVEAVKSVNKLFIQPSIRSNVRSVLDHPLCDSSSESFWVVASAVRTFYHKHQLLPVSGSVPDMTSDSKSYVDLQAIFRAKMEEDIDEVSKEVANVSSQRTPLPDVSKSYIAHMCKHIHDIVFVRLGRFTSFSSLSSDCARDLGNQLEDPAGASHVLIAMWGSESFFEKHGRPVGASSSDEDEVALLSKCVEDVVAALGLANNSINNDIVAELCRAGSSEIHSTASLLGGVAAQEAIKLLTHQFVPVNNTYVFDGIHCSATTLRLW